MELLYEIFALSFLVALVLGATANKTSFCTMGAVSDLVNMGDSGRLRAWVLAMAIAMLGVAILQSFMLVDMSLVNNPETAKPPYTTPQFVWLRYILGGILFGIGMTLGSGCGNKTLVRMGAGNLKSIVVFLLMGVGAYLMIFTDFGHDLFIQWMSPLALDFTNYGIPSQALNDVIGGVFGIASSHLLTALVLGGFLLTWAFRSEDLRADAEKVISGIVVGLAVISVWYLTAGERGVALLEEADFFDAPHFDLGAQSLTFVKPSAHFYYLIQEGFAFNFVTLALVLSAGVILGSMLYAVLTRTFRIEWFHSIGDAINHIVGGFLMGVGGVLSLGCTFGQAITGASTLAIGSFVTFASIILGAALTMKTQYYKMVYEDEASWGSALLAALADLHIVPQRLRTLARV